MPETSRKKYLLILILVMITGAAAWTAVSAAAPGATIALLPQLPGWTFSEEAKLYGPESLFEYIDGAAESYISYNFIDAAVGQYKPASGASTMTAEIYDMGLPMNAFGIYTAERYTESVFLAIGVQGYIEDGSLNFLAGRYYVKLMAYETGAKTAEILKAFAAEILKKIGDPGGFPPVLKSFPRPGLVPNSEKYILKNFLGLEFLKNGTVASYKLSGRDVDGFVMEFASDAEAAAMLQRYLDKAAANKIVPEKQGSLFHLKDPYLAHVFIGKAGRFLYGATKVEDAILDEGGKLAAGLGANLSGK
jgi:hypothetical protein